MEALIETTDGWEAENLLNPRTFELHTVLNNFQLTEQVKQCPILTTSDLFIQELSAVYERPVKLTDGFTTGDSVVLFSNPMPEPGDLPQKRSYSDGKVTISTIFYWPPPPGGIIAGYTAPLSRWVETKIDGLTSETIVLHGYYSQTYRPMHHNFAENFLFEPRLETGIPVTQLDELRAKNIRLVYFYFNGYFGSKIVTYGFDPEDAYKGRFAVMY